MNGHNLASVRAHNRGAVIRLLARHGALSRREIALWSGLDASTITHIIAGFLASGLVRERSESETPAPSRRGRPETAIELVPGGAGAIGVHLDVDRARVGLVDLRGRILGQVTLPRTAATPPAETMGAVAGAIDDLIEAGGIDRERVVGVGVGAVAFIDPASESIQTAPSLGWSDVPVVNELTARTGLATLLDHHVRAMALAEQWFGHARHVDDFALVHVDSSIGVGLVLDGELRRGARWHAGQIAHAIDDEDGPVCSCGRRGCIVTLGSYRALAFGARDLALHHPDAPLARRLAAEPVANPARVVIEEARRGDPSAQAMVARMISHIARSVTAIAALVDPRLIVLSTGQPEDVDLLVGPLSDYLAGHAPSYRGAPPAIVATALGAELPVVGAATLALERIIAEPEWLGDAPPRGHRATLPAALASPARPAVPTQK